MKKIFIILFSLFLPYVYASALKITELMYNPDGSDTHREWVEIYNDESQDIDISQYHFFENDTHHGLYPDSFAQLHPDERAVIVQDIDDAKSLLGSQILYIKSSFSLNNTGESIALSDENKNIIDSYSYSSDDGANGDGNSLQYVNAAWIPATPTPGEANRASQNNSSQDENGTSSDTNQENTETPIKKFNPYYSGFLVLPDVIVAQNSFPLKAFVYHIEEDKTTKKIDGYYYINFGDGNFLESSQRINSFYRYRHPGRYIISFEYYSSKLARDAGEDPDISMRKNISVLAHDLDISAVNAFDGVVLKNNISKTIILDGWHIIWKNHAYTFPRNSYLEAGNSIHILYQTLGFSPLPSKEYPLQLLSNDYKPVSFFPVVKKKKVFQKKKTLRTSKKTSRQKTKKNSIKTKTDNSIDFDMLPDAQKDFFGQSNNPYLDDYLAKNPNKLKVDFGENEIQKSLQKENSEKHNNSFYYTLASLILMLGAGRYMKYKHQKKEEKEREEDFGSIEVIE